MSSLTSSFDISSFTTQDWYPDPAKVVIIVINSLPAAPDHTDGKVGGVTAGNNLPDHF
jgi:hypothetical protein